MPSKRSRSLRRQQEVDSQPVAKKSKKNNKKSSKKENTVKMEDSSIDQSKGTFKSLPITLLSGFLVGS